MSYSQNEKIDGKRGFVDFIFADAEFNHYFFGIQICFRVSRTMVIFFFVKAMILKNLTILLTLWSSNKAFDE